MKTTINQAQDSSSADNLETLVEKGIYELYAEKQPALIQAIKQLIERGQTPAMIEKSIKRISPGIANHCYLIASYLRKGGPNYA